MVLSHHVEGLCISDIYLYDMYIIYLGVVNSQHMHIIYLEVVSSQYMYIIYLGVVNIKVRAYHILRSCQLTVHVRPTYGLFIK